MYTFSVAVLLGSKTDDDSPLQIHQTALRINLTDFENRRGVTTDDAIPNIHRDHWNRDPLPLPTCQNFTSLTCTVKSDSLHGPDSSTNNQNNGPNRIKMSHATTSIKERLIRSDPIIQNFQLDQERWCKTFDNPLCRKILMPNNRVNS